VLIEVAGRFADGQASPEELAAAGKSVDHLLAHQDHAWAWAVANEAVATLRGPDSAWTACWVARYSPWHVVQPPLGPTELADLLRHIAGNPFRPLPKGDTLPAAACRLAEAVYAGEDCSFALRDALLEAGSVELAEHFQEKSHPRGCWALDTILDRHP
jgi:hypothetical protein